MEQMVKNVIDGVDRRMIPSGQYLAVLVDEGHDFAPEWLKLVTQMVDPHTNSLLLLYDMPRASTTSGAAVSPSASRAWACRRRAAPPS
jgi:hypothetical protein